MNPKMMLRLTCGSGYQLLETVGFRVEVEPIRAKLKLTQLGSSTHVECPDSSQKPTRAVSTDTSALRRGTRLRKMSPKRSTNTRPKQSVNGGTYYYWIDYRVEVEFKDGLMFYQLLIDGVENQSFTGTVTLGPSIEAWKE
jgi:hypothetical protein